MIFNSFEFILFFPLVIILYFTFRQNHRWKLLLFSSYLFYMFWKPEYIILVMISTAIDYIVALKIEKNKNERIKKLYLIISLISNLGLLFIFKYFNLLIESINFFFNGNFDTLSLILPMGISFYTFQTLSYTIDVYRGKINAEKHLGYFAL